MWINRNILKEITWERGIDGKVHSKQNCPMACYKYYFY